MLASQPAIGRGRSAIDENERRDVIVLRFLRQPNGELLCRVTDVLAEIVDGCERARTVDAGPSKRANERANLRDEMETIMKQPRIISAGGCIAALLVAGCGGMSPSSTINPLGGVASKGAIDAPSTTAEATPRLCNRFYVIPKAATITVSQPLKLHDNLQQWDYYRNRCDESRVSAVWSSSGGSLQANPKGKSAVFSASLPGLYTVVARYPERRGQATVTVTLP